MKSYFSRLTLGVASAALMLFSVGCGSGSSGGGGNPNPQPQNGTVNLLISDASTEDWATIGVKVISITLTPQGGGNEVTLYTAPSPAPWINLLQLDQLSEILGNMTVPVGTYTAATITVSGNPGDVLLTASADPETGFAATAGLSIPSNQIQILGTKASAGSLTVPVKVTLDSPLVVTANQSNALDLEFDLAHPAFIVAHVPPSGGGTTMWAVNFNPCLRHRRIFDRTGLVLRHHYGTVTAVSTDNTTLTFDKDYPVYPPTNPETEITSSQTLSVLADSTNGTLYFDLDNSRTMPPSRTSAPSPPRLLANTSASPRATSRTARWWPCASGPAVPSTGLDQPRRPRPPRERRHRHPGRRKRARLPRSLTINATHHSISALPPRRNPTPTPLARDLPSSPISPVASRSMPASSILWPARRGLPVPSTSKSHATTVPSATAT